MKEALLVLPIILATLMPMPVSAASDNVSCNDYTGREKKACNNGRTLSNAFDAKYCQRYTSVTQIEACETGQYIGTYNYELYCSHLGADYNSCVMPTATSAPAPQKNDSGVVAPKGVSSYGECSTTNFESNESCSPAQKILKAMNLALPLVFIFAIAGIAFGIYMRVKMVDWRQQKQGIMLTWITVTILGVYCVVTLILNIVTPAGVLFDMW